MLGPNRLLAKVNYFHVLKTLDWVTMYGFDGMDVTLINTEWLMRGTYRLIEVEILGRTVADKGVRLSVHGPFIDLQIGSPDSVIRDYSRNCLLRGLEVARALGADRFVLHSHYPMGLTLPKARERWLSHCMKTWEELAQKAKKVQMVVAIENVYDPNPGVILEILDRLKSPWVKACLDVGHVKAFSKESNIEVWLDSFGKHLSVIHLHDYNGHQDHLALGNGTTDFSAFFELLKKKSLEADMVLEMFEEKEILTSKLRAEAIWNKIENLTISK